MTEMEKHMKKRNDGGYIFIFLGIIFMFTGKNTFLAFMFIAFGFSMINSKDKNKYTRRDVEDEVFKAGEQFNQGQSDKIVLRSTRNVNQSKIDIGEIMGYSEFNVAISNGKKVKAIKICRKIMKCSLQEANDAVEEIMRKYM
jgi:ribosomal protein L7/L12